MDISGSTINAYTSGGDGFDSNGSLTISGGVIAVWTANTADNQPLDADGTITVSGGTVLLPGQQRHGHEPERQPALCALWLHRRAWAAGRGQASSPPWRPRAAP